MALFKILKGDSSRISTSITKFTEGYAYFTPDDGKLYIDATVSGTEKRICINPNNSGSCVAINAVLSKDAWSGGQQTVNVTGVTENSNGVVGLSQSISDSAMEAAKGAALFISGQGNGTITIAVSGEAPTTDDIPIVVLLFG